MKKENFTKITVPVIVLVVFFTPDTSIGNIFHAIGFSLFVLIFYKNLKIDTNIGTIGFFLVFIVSLATSIIIGGMWSTFNDFVKSIMVLFFFLFFPIDAGSHRLDVKIIIIMVLSLLISQLATILDVKPLSTLITDIYYSTGSIKVRSTQTIYEFFSSSYRSGGFLGNPNQAAKFVNLIFAYYVFFVSRYSSRSLNFTFYLIIFVSMLLTGSRSGFLITIITIITLFINKSFVRKLKTIVPVVISVIVAYIYIVESYDYSIRSLSLVQGLDSSFLVKIRLITDYLSRLDDIVVLFFGNFFSATGGIYYPNVFYRVGFNFDFDVGYFLYAFGIMGTICLFLKMFRILKENQDVFRFWPIFLWFFTGSIFFHFRFMLFMMIIVSLATSQKTGKANCRETMLYKENL